MTTIIVEDPSYTDGELQVPRVYRYSIKVLRVSASEAYEEWKRGDKKGEMPAKIMHVIPVYPGLRPILIGAYCMLQAILASSMLYFGATEQGLAPWAQAVLALQCLHVLFSFARVTEEEKGGVLFWGKPVREVQSGWQFVPMGVLQLRTFPRGLINQQFPGPPEKTYRGGEEGTDKSFFELPIEEREGLNLPIRVTTGGKEAGTEREKGELDTLDTQMTVEVHFYIRWRIEHLWVFVVRMHTVERAQDQFRYSAQRPIIEEIAKRTPKKIIEDISKINDVLYERLESLTEDWGVYIVESALLSPDLSHGVNAELRNVTSEKAKATQAVTKAHAEKERLTLEGEGKASAKLAELKAFAEGARALGLDGQSVIDLEKSRALAQGKTTIFIDGGSESSHLLGLGARLATGGAEALKRSQVINEKEVSDG